MKNALTALKKFRLIGNKHEEAVDLYKQAANAYKMEKQWLNAGNAFLKQAECYLALQSKHDIASAYYNAATCFEKCNIHNAINALTLSCEIYTNEGNFSIAGKQQEHIGFLYEKDDDIVEALKHWRLAVDYYEGENQMSAAAKLNIKIAEHKALAKQYEVAINLFEFVGKLYLENTLLKWSAKDLFFKAGICHLCSDDLEGFKRALDKYKDLDVTFQGQRECKLLTTLIECVEFGDSNKLVSAIRDFNSITPLDPWKTIMLKQLKDSIIPVAIMSDEDMT